jgi:beta-lactamase class D
MVIETFSYTTGDYTLTCDTCGHTASDPTIGWLVGWFRQNHTRKGCNPTVTIGA